MKQKTQMQYLIDELIDRAKTDDMISLKLVIGLAVVRLEKDKEQIKRSFVAGYQVRSMEDVIGGTGNEENEYYDSNFGDSNEAGI